MNYTKVNRKSNLQRFFPTHLGKTAPARKLLRCFRPRVESERASLEDFLLSLNGMQALMADSPSLSKEATLHHGAILSAPFATAAEPSSLLTARTRRGTPQGPEDVVRGCAHIQKSTKKNQSEVIYLDRNPSPGCTWTIRGKPPRILHSSLYLRS